MASLFLGLTSFQMASSHAPLHPERLAASGYSGPCHYARRQMATRRRGARGRAKRKHTRTDAFSHKSLHTQGCFTHHIMPASPPSVHRQCPKSAESGVFPLRQEIIYGALRPIRTCSDTTRVLQFHVQIVGTQKLLPSNSHLSMFFAEHALGTNVSAHRAVFHTKASTPPTRMCSGSYAKLHT